MEAIPNRIQRKRTRGYKSLAGSIYVGRGTKFGNPFRLIGDMIYYDAGHRRKIADKWVLFYETGGHQVFEVVDLYRDLLLDPDTQKHIVEPEIRDKFRVMRDNIETIVGKPLSCWCKPSEPCHADELIDFANKYSTL